MYNPYDLVPMLINGQEIHGRPIEFDSEVADQNAMTNAFGNVVKPSKLSSCCPDCGQGLEYDVYLDEPPFSAVQKICYHCNPAPGPQDDPFMNPITDGRIPEHELDPLLHDPGQQVIDDEDSSVAERFKFDTVPDDGSLSEADTQLLEKAKKKPEKAAKKKTTKKVTKAEKAPKKAKKKPPKAKKPINKKAAREPAEGVGGEEPDGLDDLVETE